MEYVPQFREKVGHKLFPARYAEMPEVKGHMDELVIGVRCNLSIIDRIRCLISGSILVETRTSCQNFIGSHVTCSSVCVLPPNILTRK